MGRIMVKVREIHRFWTFWKFLLMQQRWPVSLREHRNLEDRKPLEPFLGPRHGVGGPDPVQANVNPARAPLPYRQVSVSRSAGLSKIR